MQLVVFLIILVSATSDITVSYLDCPIPSISSTTLPNSTCLVLESDELVITLDCTDPNAVILFAYNGTDCSNESTPIGNLTFAQPACLKIFDNIVSFECAEGSTSEFIYSQVPFNCTDLPNQFTVSGNLSQCLTTPFWGESVILNCTDPANPTISSDSTKNDNCANLDGFLNLTQSFIDFGSTCDGIGDRLWNLTCTPPTTPTPTAKPKPTPSNAPKPTAPTKKTKKVKGKDKKKEGKKQTGKGKKNGQKNGKNQNGKQNKNGKQNQNGNQNGKQNVKIIKAGKGKK